MKRPPKEAFEEYANSKAGREYIESPEFTERCVELFDKLENGMMTMSQAALAVGLPFAAFRYVFALYLVGLKLEERDKLN